MCKCQEYVEICNKKAPVRPALFLYLYDTMNDVIRQCEIPILCKKKTIDANGQTSRAGRPRPYDIISLKHCKGRTCAFFALMPSHYSGTTKNRGSFRNPGNIRLMPEYNYFVNRMSAIVPSALYVNTGAMSSKPVMKPTGTTVLPFTV